MGKKDPRVDAYIDTQQDFARPILTFLRDVIHEGCPEVVETLKWNTPAFDYNGILCGFAGFKQHTQFGFWKHDLVVPGVVRDGMGFGRVTSIDELPSRRELIAFVRKAAELNAKGIKAPRVIKKKKAAIPIPRELKTALAKNKKARSAYDDFSPSHKREYHQWIAEAKGDDTRARRVKQAVDWMAAGKSRNWKYT